MRILLAATFLVCCLSVGFAQSQSAANLCNRASATTVDNDAGVTLQKVILTGKWGSNEATAYLPDKETADAAVVVSHSEIHSNSGASVELLPLALTLARAGAAVIVLKRTLKWPPTDRSTNREGAVVVCAEHWLVRHTKLLNDGKATLNEKGIVMHLGYAYVGPKLCGFSPSYIGLDPTDDDDCEFTDPFVSEPCAHRHEHCMQIAWVPIGETQIGETQSCKFGVLPCADNTDSIISDEGLETARFLQKQLGLAPFDALASQKSGSGP